VDREQSSEKGVIVTISKVNAPGLARLPAFCHAVVAGDFIYVSGTLGTQPNSMDLVEGGTGPETAQALRNIAVILRACGASLADLVKVNVFLADIQTFSEMNEAYLVVMGAEPPARITVGRAALALGAAVEIDGVAYKPKTEAGKRPRLTGDTGA
jgi:2-iminobutanoate/2-iminopropanoate deaminase